MPDNRTPDEGRGTRTPSGAIRLRRIDAIAKARHRLTRVHRAHCPLTGAGEADLLVREDMHRADSGAQGLPLSTRFGPAIAYDYAALLLACTGIDLTHPRKPPAHVALARYGFAALAPALQSALGEPTVSETAAPSLDSEATFPVNLLLRLPSMRLTMRWLVTAAGLHALLDSDPWHPVATPPPLSLPPWLSSLDAAIGGDIGESSVPLAEYNRLAPGDIVLIAQSAFDVAGRAVVRVGSCGLHVRWLATHRCFEVENMTHIPDSPSDAACPSNPATALSTVDQGDIPVRLSFSLGTLRATVGDVAALRPGSLLELKRGMPPEVTIEANGMTIGSGELVDLDGRLAVEIMHWPHPRTPSPTS